MSEQLGEALLVLRTDDRGLTAGVEAARAKGEALGRSLDNTSAAAGNLGKSLGAAGSAAAGVGHQLDSASGSATKLTQQLTQSARASEQVVAGHTRMSASGMMVMHSVRAVSDSIAVGLPITMILTEQMGRLSEAAALAGGGSGALGRLGAFMGGPWGLAVMVAVSALGQLVSRMDLFENKLVENARLLDKVKAADDGLSDAQSALGEMFDLTTVAQPLTAIADYLLGLVHKRLEGGPPPEAGALFRPTLVTRASSRSDR